MKYESDSESPERKISAKDNIKYSGVLENKLETGKEAEEIRYETDMDDSVEELHDHVISIQQPEVVDNEPDDLVSSFAFL